MFYHRFFFVTLLLVMLATGCKKNSLSATCNKLKEGMITNNVADVKTLVTQFINELHSKDYTEQNLNKLAVSLSQCSISADVLCFDCIQTNPGQSEIRVSFTSSGSAISKAIDISHSPGDSKMKVVNMHD